jgi:hypothetical protein
MRENASFAGEADPYRHDDDEADTGEADAVEADTTAVVDDDTTTVAEPTPSAQTASEVEEAETTPDINHDGE